MLTCEPPIFEFLPKSIQNTPKRLTIIGNVVPTTFHMFWSRLAAFWIDFETIIFFPFLISSLILKLVPKNSSLKTRP